MNNNVWLGVVNTGPALVVHAENSTTIRRATMNGRKFNVITMNIARRISMARDGTAH